MEVDPSAYGEGSNLVKASELAINNPALAQKIEQWVTDPNYFYTNADFGTLAEPGFASFLATISPYQDGGLHMAADVFQAADLVANIPVLWPAKVVTTPLSYGTTIARDIYDQNSSQLTKDLTFIGLDLATMGLFKGAGALSNQAGRVITNRAAAGASAGLSTLSAISDAAQNAPPRK